MRAEDADRLAGLHEQRLVAVQRLEGRDDAIEAVPVARGAADAAVDDELVRLLGDLRIEVVHEHAERRLGQPALGRDLGTARRADEAGVVDAAVDRHDRLRSVTQAGRGTSRTVCATLPVVTSSVATAMSGAR